MNVTYGALFCLLLQGKLFILKELDFLEIMFFKILSKYEKIGK